MLAGRAFARIEDGRVLFKAELGAVSARVAQIQGVWVDPEYRGRGLGTLGTAAVVAEALRTVAPTVSLYVNDFNVPARRAYERVGLRNVGTFCQRPVLSADQPDPGRCCAPPIADARRAARRRRPARLRLLPRQGQARPRRRRVRLPGQLVRRRRRRARRATPTTAAAATSALRRLGTALGDGAKLTATLGAVTKQDDDHATAAYTASWQLPGVGAPWRYDGTLPLVRTQDTWGVQWQPADLHPKLTAAGLASLKVEHVLPERAALQDAAGAPLFAQDRRGHRRRAAEQGDRPARAGGHARRRAQDRRGRHRRRT